MRRVVDGDTYVVVDGTEVTVRHIGIDTPETVHPDRPVDCWGPQATARVAELLEGRQVRLETDPATGPVDRYGRRLAYVWTGDVLVGADLLAGGWAREYTHAGHNHPPPGSVHRRRRPRPQHRRRTVVRVPAGGTTPSRT